MHFEYMAVAAAVSLAFGLVSYLLLHRCQEYGCLAIAWQSSPDVYRRPDRRSWYCARHREMNGVG